MLQARFWVLALLLALGTACGLPLEGGEDPDSGSSPSIGAARISDARYQEEPAGFTFKVSGSTTGTYRVQRCLPDEGCVDHFSIQCSGVACTVRDASRRASAGKTFAEVNSVNQEATVVAGLCEYNLRSQPAQARFQLVPPGGTEAEAVLMRRDIFLSADRCSLSRFGTWFELL
jgi:hypothetical protein